MGYNYFLRAALLLIFKAIYSVSFFVLYFPSEIRMAPLVVEALFRKPMPDAVLLVRQPTGLALLNYRRPLDLSIFIPDF